MKKLFLFTLLAVWFAAGCNLRREERFIAVTIEPQRYFAEKIAGGKFHIYTVVPAGQSPETYDATPRQMLRFNRCAAYLLMGSHLGFEESWIRNILDNNPQMKVFNLSEGFPLIMEESESSHHSHHHGGADPHIWSSIEGAGTIARNTLHAFITLDRENEAFYKQNFNTLMQEIEATASAIRSKLEPLDGRAFIIYHPALTYFAHEYGLEQLSIEFDGKEPSPAQLKQLMDAAATHGVRVIFVQQEFDQNNARRMAEATGCRLVSINLQSYDWSGEMIRIADALADGE